MGNDLESLYIEIRLIEAVKEHQPGSPGGADLLSHMGDRREKRAELYRDRDLDLASHISNQMQVGRLQLGSALLQACREIVDIQLQRVCSRLLNLRSVLHPSACSHAIQT